MIVSSVNHAEFLPRCRASFTMAPPAPLSVRSGVPTLVLWLGADQLVRATPIKRLGGRHLASFLRHDAGPFRRVDTAAVARLAAYQLQSVIARRPDKWAELFLRTVLWVREAPPDADLLREMIGVAAQRLIKSMRGS